MPLVLTTILSLIFSCYLWEVETRTVTGILSVKNGGPWGEWGKEEYCPRGYIDGFSLKLPEENTIQMDKTGIIGIRAHCSDGSVIKSSVGKGGTWSEEISCWYDYLKAFSLRVTKPKGVLGDDTAVNNIKFSCSGSTEQEGDGPAWGEYGDWSESCKVGDVCGIQTKIEKPQGLHKIDRTELNDVKFFCCE